MGPNSKTVTWRKWKDIKHRQNRGILGPCGNMKNSIWPKNAGKKRADGEPRNGAKVENRDLKKWKDTKTQAKSGYFRTGQKSEKHRLAENRGKNGPTASPKLGLKSKIVF